MVTTALGRLFRYDRDLRWAIIVEAYMDDQINLGKAAELQLALGNAAATVEEVHAELQSVQLLLSPEEVCLPLRVSSGKLLDSG